MSGLGSSSALRGHVGQWQNTALPARLIQTPGPRSGSPSGCPQPWPGLPQTSSTLRLSPSSLTPVAPGACPRAEHDTHGSLDAPAFQAFLPRAGPSGPCSPVSRAHSHPSWARGLCSSLLPLPARPCPVCPRPGHLGREEWMAATKLGLQDSPARNRVFLQLRGGHSPSTVSGKGPCLGESSKTAVLPGGRGSSACAVGGPARPQAPSRVPAGLRRCCGP